MELDDFVDPLPNELDTCVRRVMARLREWPVSR
jgi:hypothetical protein